MKLLSLHLSNFKGCRSFDLEPKGNSCNVYGDNGTYKTTLFDAFLWLLFDKDSQNRKDFEIKTIGPDGEYLHGLDHSVEATLEIDGAEILTLKKVYMEKWTKKRGSPKAEFTGHTTDYYIDGVPVKKSEYEAKISSIADEDIFKLLTSPKYFNEQLHWQERRKILLQVCGDVTDSDVIASDSTLSKLPEILGNRSIDDHRKVIMSRRSEINKELERIPVRIDEVQRGLPDIRGVDESEIQESLSNLKKHIKAKEQQLVRLESGGEIAEKTKKLREIESELIDIKNHHQTNASLAIQKKQAEYSKAREEYMALKGEISNIKQAIEKSEQEVAALEKTMAELRGKWHAVNQEKLEFEPGDVCPTCGQALPPAKVAAMRKKALAEFNRQKAERLEAITAEGKELRAKADALIAENEEAEKRLAELAAKFEAEDRKVQRLQKEIEELQQDMNAYDKNQIWLEKINEKEVLERAIAKLKTGREGEMEAIRADIARLEKEVEQAEDYINQIRRHEEGQKRIKELKEEERKLAAEYENLESELYLTEQFIRAKVKLLEDKINNRFQHARFKLFEIQVNGAVVETCETLYQGVPYPDLNGAAKINIGLDIINTLSEYYGFSAPIFIDNREAVTRLIDTKAQVISLIVSERDKKLRVEIPQQQGLFKEEI